MDIININGKKVVFLGELSIKNERDICKGSDKIEITIHGNINMPDLIKHIESTFGKLI